MQQTSNCPEIVLINYSYAGNVVNGIFPFALAFLLHDEFLACLSDVSIIALYMVDQ